MMVISILVLTKNEEKDLPGCLESVSWSDDVHVFDSFSNDSTVAIARRAGATVTQRYFDDWSSHQNWGLRNIPFKHEWVFYIDADERMTAELQAEIQKCVKSGDNLNGYRVTRRDFYNGTWLKHVQPTSQYIRLFRPSFIHYERLVNPTTIVNGQVGGICAYLDHYPFSKGLTHWIARHNNYSTLEAQEICAGHTERKRNLIRSFLAERDYTRRRKILKQIFYSLPYRPALKFFYLYFMRLGILDGRAGFVYATLQAIYEYFIVLKTRELKERR